MTEDHARPAFDWRRLSDDAGAPEPDFVTVVRSVGWGRVQRVAEHDVSRWYWFASTWESRFVDGFTASSRDAAAEVERRLVELGRLKGVTLAADGRAVAIDPEVAVA